MRRSSPLSRFALPVLCWMPPAAFVSVRAPLRVVDGAARSEYDGAEHRRRPFLVRRAMEARLDVFRVARGELPL
jgi:hypothetical protein